MNTPLMNTRLMNARNAESSPGLLFSSRRYYDYSRRLIGLAVYLVLGALVVSAPASLALDRIYVPGKFEVDQTGAATYSIPIEIPPGTAGMVPNVSLEYNSHRGDGLVGVGWSVAGLGVITRCAKTIAQDGVKGSISFTSSDRFCLNGKRLMGVSGTYGTNGATYRTESESFARITSYGNIGGGPTWFKVETKDGRIMEYGNTPDSRTNHNVVVSWALNKVSDRSGNYYTAEYAKDDLVFWPLRIKYTGNQNNGQATYNEVEFLYFSTRPGGSITVPTLYGFGTMDTLLGAVRTKNTSSIVKGYWISYQYGGATNRLRVSRIHECQGDNSSACIVPTEFDYGDNEGSINKNWSGTHGVGSEGWKLADVFGDGRKIHLTTHGTLQHYGTLLNADGTRQNWTWNGTHGVASEGWKVGDLFGDGRELYYTVDGTGKHYATRLNPNGSVQNWVWQGGHSPDRH